MSALNDPLFLLAPMDGMTRASFRSICFDYGADGATTEMIQSLAYGRAKKRMSEKFEETLVRYPNEHNLAAQLIGSVPAAMADIYTHHGASLPQKTAFSGLSIV